MKVLHIAPHLGGGVGKAHMTLARARAARRDAGGSDGPRHSYALLEPPRDLAYAEAIARAGEEVHVLPLPGRLAALAEEADIVQVEWWNHPRLYQWLTSHPLPAIRLATWIHISGLGPPLVPRALADLADRTLFTSAASLGAANLATALARRPGAFSVVNSGFGLDRVARVPREPGAPLRCAYLGTVDFIKMHPGLFGLLDAAGLDIRLDVWGRHDPAGEVARAAAAMRHPERVRFRGYTTDPAAVLAATDLFVYLLAPGHYGTAENALVEAMSAGAVPVVWDNPSEAAIVAHGRTGYVVGSDAEFIACLAAIRDGTLPLERPGALARASVRRHRGPAASLRALDEAHAAVMRQPKRPRDFRAALGADAGAWFLSSLSDAGSGAPQDATLLSDRPAKGSLGHFRLCCPEDGSLAALDARPARVA